mmetsp:Transcript_51508/g.111728  ORF Transcript_51508/g.111728 Transcript_51508/m.111728 type:complete len:284 (-) Transcript_51508:65-916(-)
MQSGPMSSTLCTSSGEMGNWFQTTSMRCQAKHAAEEPLTSAERRPKSQSLASILAAWPPPCHLKFVSAPSTDSPQLALQGLNSDSSAIATLRHSSRAKKSSRGRSEQHHYLDWIDQAGSSDGALRHSNSRAPWPLMMASRPCSVTSVCDDAGMFCMPERVHANGIGASFELRCVEALPRSWPTRKPITTFMIGNLPYRARKEDIANAVDNMGLAGTYHICRVPSTSSPKCTNLGYGFICFTDECTAAAFINYFSHFQLSGRTSRKQSTLKFAHSQCKYFSAVT